MRETTVQLPEQIAPQLVERVERLLAEVPLVTIDRTLPVPSMTIENVCVVCHEGGKLGGHHGPEGRVEWVHKSCHRRIHRRGAPTRKARALAHRLELLAS